LNTGRVREILRPVVRGFFSLASRSCAIDFGFGLEILFSFFACPGGTNQIGVSHFKRRVVAKIGAFDRVFPRRRTVVEANKDNARVFATFSSVDLFVSFLTVIICLLLLLLLSLRTGAATAKR
jgi:hypothetical protein